jgi:hypothetical protein
LAIVLWQIGHRFPHLGSDHASTRITSRHGQKA